jgi:hypothetical protein
MGRARLVVAAFILLPSLSARAQERPCTPQLIDAGPLLAGPGSADFGQVPEACPATDLFLRLRGELLLDQDDFHGTVTGGLTLRGRWEFAPQWYLSAALDAATLRHSVNAVVASTGVGFGPITVGVHRAFFLERLAVTPYLRLLLPPDTARNIGVRLGGEAGGSASLRILERGSLRGGISLPATLVVIGGGGHGIFATSGLLEGAYAIKPWFAVAAGAVARVQAAPQVELSAMAARLSLRIQDVCGWHLAVAGDVPLDGKDRTDTTISIFVGRGPSRAGSGPPPIWPWRWTTTGMPPEAR